jgi:hypothetical protein
MLPLTTPVRGGTIDDLRPFINCGTSEDWILIIAFLLAAFRPQGPHPVLALFGEQGSAKSTTASVIRRLVDPHEADRRTQPKDLQDLFLAARNSWMLNFDNLSYIGQDLSDAFCQIATGGAKSKRALYTDDGGVRQDFLATITSCRKVGLGVRRPTLEGHVAVPRGIPPLPAFSASTAARKICHTPTASTSRGSRGPSSSTASRR